MEKTSGVIAFLVLSMLVCCGAPAAQAPVSPPASGRPCLPAVFVERQGTGFSAGGRSFFFAGTNCYYLMVHAADPALRGHVDEVLGEAAAMGLRVVRTWAFNDGATQWNALQTAPGTYQEYVFQGLDYVIWQAGRRGLRVLLPLVNNWDDYGGMNQYVAWSPTASSHDDFYTDAMCRTWYQDHAAAVLARVNTFTGVRYSEDPTIFAWELANEARCTSDPSGDVLQDWIETMSAHIKALDPQHLVGTGSEGFYGASGPRPNPHGWMASQGTDFVRNHLPGTVDFASLHVWPDHWQLDLAQTVQWIDDHAGDAASQLGKPVIVGEFGKSQPLAERDLYFQSWYDAIYRSASTGGAAGGSCLWILYHDNYPDYDGFGVYYPAHASTVAIVAAEAGKMNGL